MKRSVNGNILSSIKLKALFNNGARLIMTPDLLQVAMECNRAGLIVMQGKVKYISREPGAGDGRLVTAITSCPDTSPCRGRGR